MPRGETSGWLPSSMALPDPLQVTPALAIPLAELTVRATRSSGPGGQHVNTSSTRIEVVFDIANSPSLNETQRTRLLETLGARLHGEGRLRVVAQSERSQLQNREAAIGRLGGILRRALAVPRVRRPTKPTRASRERRLKEKKARGALKRDRRRLDD